jgi:multiple sugar transport system substrate-binding protein
MGALRPFSKREVSSMGGASAFLPPVWQSAVGENGTEVWAIPWLADVRVVYYWRDLLRMARVDEREAFWTAQQMKDTLGRLQAAGVTPWIVPTHARFLTLHNAASWVWGNGGDFVSPSGRRILFNEPEARTGLCSYFDLHRYLPPDCGQVDNAGAYRLFASRQAAVTMGPCGWVASLCQQSGLPDGAGRLGVALPPGPAYVGGSNLVVWRHSRHAWESVKLVRLLTSQKAQVEFCPRVGHLPVLNDALNEPPYSDNPHFLAMVEALRTGRCYPTFLRWGLVEERLSAAFISIWNDLLPANSHMVDDVLGRHLDPVAGRLEMALA